MFSKSDIHRESTHDGIEYDRQRILLKIKRLDIEYLKKLSLKKREKQKVNHKLSKDKIQEILKLFLEGISITKIAKIFKISYNGARYHLLKGLSKKQLLHLYLHK